MGLATSLWVGLAAIMGVRGARRLPANVSQPMRLAFGSLTFLLWYVGMLAAAAALAAFTVRTFREVGSTLLALLAVTGAVWGLRRLVRHAFA